MHLDTFTAMSILRKSVKTVDFIAVCIFSELQDRIQGKNSLKNGPGNVKYVRKYELSSLFLLLYL